MMMPSTKSPFDQTTWEATEQIKKKKAPILLLGPQLSTDERRSEKLQSKLSHSQTLSILSGWSSQRKKKKREKKKKRKEKKKKALSSLPKNSTHLHNKKEAATGQSEPEITSKLEPREYKLR